MSSATPGWYLFYYYTPIVDWLAFCCAILFGQYLSISQILTIKAFLGHSHLVHKFTHRSLWIILWQQIYCIITKCWPQYGHSRGTMQRRRSCQYSLSIHDYVVPTAVCRLVLYACTHWLWLYSCLVDPSEHRIHPGVTTHTHTHTWHK